MIGDALRRIGKIDRPDPEVVSESAPWAYRNKITLTRTASGSGFGFHRWDRPDEVFELRRCEIAAAELNSLWTLVRQQLDALPPRADRVVLRLDRDGARHIVASGAGDRVWAGAARLAAALEADGLPTSLWYEPAGQPVRLVAGPPSDHRATVFEQVNPAMGARVRRDAIAELGSVTGQHVWDLYAGVGDASRLLAEAGATVEAVERDPLAGEQARPAAGGLPITWYHGEVETMLTVLRPSDHVLVNPPRAGLSRVASGRLADRCPRRIVYVSCDPATLARDLGHLVASGAGYQVTQVRAYDLFPQTAHVEAVARVDRL
jgi:23S rRNA (uracil1939-C5)-methyltransferase